MCYFYMPDQKECLMINPILSIQVLKVFVDMFWRKNPSMCFLAINIPMLFWKLMIRSYTEPMVQELLKSKQTSIYLTSIKKVKSLKGYNISNMEDSEGDLN